MTASLRLTYSLADQNFFQTKTLGVLNLSTQLLEALARHPCVSECFVLANSSLAGQIPQNQKVSARNFDQPLSGKLGRILWDQLGVTRAARAAGHPWLFLPKGFCPTVRSHSQKFAVYVHDTIHDFYRVNYPQAIGKAESFYFERSFRAVLKNARLIFTNSNYTLSELKRLARELNLPCPSGLKAGIGFTAPPLQTAARENRLVVLAGRFPHKATRLAVDFLNRWQQEARFTGQIDWIGSFPPDVTLPTWPGWRHLQRLPEPEFRRAFDTAKALVYFSHYEGFGMPPVEATLAGVAPIYSDLPATREAMLNLGFPFSNTSYESFASALNSGLKASPTHLESWTKMLLTEHDWDKVAERVARTMLESS